jgi:hypothetical protein
MGRNPLFNVGDHALLLSGDAQKERGINSRLDWLSKMEACVGIVTISGVFPRTEGDGTAVYHIAECEYGFFYDEAWLEPIQTSDSVDETELDAMFVEYGTTDC